MIRFDVLEPEFADAIDKLEASAQDVIKGVLEMVGIQTIAYLRSLTDEMQPPIYKAEGERPAHPGGWADISGDLARGYGWEVYGTPSGAVLRLYNMMDYAAALEAKEGYFVLSGVTDPGGPVEQALREVGARLGLRIWRY